MGFIAILAVIVVANGAMLLTNKLPADETRPMALVLAACAATLMVAGVLCRSLLRSDSGSSAMHVVYAAIKEGAEAFMRRQYRTIAMLAVVTTALVYALYAFVRSA